MANRYEKFLETKPAPPRPREPDELRRTRSMAVMFAEENLGESEIQNQLSDFSQRMVLPGMEITWRTPFGPVTLIPDVFERHGYRIVDGK